MRPSMYPLVRGQWSNSSRTLQTVGVSNRRRASSTAGGWVGYDMAGPGSWETRRETWYPPRPRLANLGFRRRLSGRRATRSRKRTRLPGVLEDRADFDYTRMAVTQARMTRPSLITARPTHPLWYGG